eukprot:SAG31_NODE_747_length_12395_cov_129.196405_10_plen_105_part_00
MRAGWIERLLRLEGPARKCKNAAGELLCSHFRALILCFVRGLVGAVPPDVVDRSRAGMGCHGMQAYFVQLVHVAANLVCLNFDTRKDHYRCAQNAYFYNKFIFK